MAAPWRRVYTPLVRPLLLALLLAAAPARAQIDPKGRQLLQLGWDQPLSGGQVIGYGFYYLNRPDFYRRDTTLRLVAAPIYLDTELGLARIAKNTDMGIGLSGGGLAYGHNEIRDGSVINSESFRGHGLAVSLSVYRTLNPGKMIPLGLVLRAGSSVAAYESGPRTDRDFRVPADHMSHFARAGVRWGGQEPELGKSALELSVWYEGKFRSRDIKYGYNEDRMLRQDAYFAWTRAHMAYNFPESKRYASATITMGTSGNADRLNAWRLGGSLPLVSEFPLSIPGYAHQELTGRSFALMEARGLTPVDSKKRLGVGLWGAVSSVDYLPGFEQHGSINSGVGAWTQYDTPQRRWRMALQYGYAVHALRGGRRGAHGIGMMVQYNIGAPDWGLPFDPKAPSDRPRGGYPAIRDRLLPLP